MKYTGTIYRPPIEANTLLLQVTVGCAHNQCSFCTMYRDVRFRVEQMDQIEKDLQEAKSMYGSLKRIFLVNGDAFVLSASRLKKISAKIIEYFPEMEVITMYASIRNIKGKTDAELLELHEARINDLWIGLETGHAGILDRLNKGYSSVDAYDQLERLNKANIRHNAIFMLGAGGKGRGFENALATAKLVNQTKPSFLGFTTLGLFPGSDLAKEAQLGLFKQATELEIFEEEKALIEHITLDNIPFFADHPLNATSLRGILPQDKDRMIRQIDETIQRADDNYLSGSLERLYL